MKKGVKIGIFVGVGCLVLGLVFFVIVILGVAILPSFVNVQRDATEASFNGTVAMVNTEINMYRAMHLIDDPTATYPATLDNEQDGPCVQCFILVHEKGINDSHWSKTGPTTYVYEDRPFSKNVTYDPVQGELSAQ